MNVETIDCVLLMNSFEALIRSLSGKVSSYHDKMAKVFEFYEAQIQKGRLRYYGITGNESLIMSPMILRDLMRRDHYITEEQVRQQLQGLVNVAEKVGGKYTHHFKFLQAPYNRKNEELDKMHE